MRTKVFILTLISIGTIQAQILSRPNNKFTTPNTVKYERTYVETPEPPKKVYTADDIVIRKEFEYDKYTLADEYPYLKTTRMFQWDKIKAGLALLETVQREPSLWGIAKNQKNINGVAPAAKGATLNDYNNLQDRYGAERYQGIPLYDSLDLITPERYEHDGSLLRLNNYTDTAKFVNAESIYIGGNWMIPKRYVKPIDQSVTRFDKVIFVDRTNQNICTLEKRDGDWVVLSMNPATTGARRPPFQKPTPLGIFVIQEKKERMIYMVDGTSRIGGFAPWASRFCSGGYIHGVPVNLPATAIVEYSATLGTVPRSHMCIRNVTSHAIFIYNWAPVEKSLLFVIE